MARRLIDRLIGSVPDGTLPATLGLPVPAAVRLVACGSSSCAAQVTAHVLATACGVPARVVTVSEHTTGPDGAATLTVALSQSGETADILAARDTWRGPWLAITNNAHSSLARCCDAVLDLTCGPELGVAATKSFTAQVIAGSLFALSVGAARDTVDPDQLRHWVAALHGLPDRLAASDALARPVAARLATELADRPGWIYVSRGAGVPYALEGALKLKELAYRWVEALPAGELQHGPIALVQAGTPVVLIRAQPTARLAVNAANWPAAAPRSSPSVGQTRYHRQYFRPSSRPGGPSRRPSPCNI